MLDYKEMLGLTEHIEGGFFNVFYTSQDKVLPLSNRYSENGMKTKPQNLAEHHHTPDNKLVERSTISSIYFLLEKDAYSSWHRLKSDEIWHYYDGNTPIDIHSIDKEGNLSTQTLGNPSKEINASFQVVITAGKWFAAELRDKSGFALAGCTVAPGFEYEDFELGDREQLMSMFPNYKEIIVQFTNKL